MKFCIFYPISQKNLIVSLLLKTLGVLSNAYLATTLKDKATTADLMLVGGVYIIALGIFSPLSPALIRFGARLVMLLGTIITSLGLVLASFSSEVWHVMLTQGFLCGLGVSLVYIVR
jgi:MFS family permease